MLSPLLAALLCAASDPASLTDSIAQRAADSAALEKVSPLPASSKAPASKAGKTPPPVRTPVDFHDSTGPLTKGAVGLGFRVLGDTPLLQVHYAISTWNFLRLRGSYLRTSETASRDLEQSPLTNSGPGPVSNAKKIDVEASSSSMELQVAITGLGRCQGALCGSWSVGPFLARQVSTIENTETQTFQYEYRERRAINRLGIAGSVGLSWEFRKGLALSADAGASMARIYGERYQTSTSTFSSPFTVFHSEEEPKGSEFSIQFLGVGLDAWF